MEMSDETRKDITEFQSTQQQLQMLMMQKQQLSLQLSELQKVLEELAKASPDAKLFRSVGAVMVPKSKAELEKDLAGEKESVELRSSVIAKQEEKMSSKLIALQDKIRASQPSLGGEGGSLKPKRG